jgi:hypothetical protein
MEKKRLKVVTREGLVFLKWPYLEQQVAKIDHEFATFLLSSPLSCLTCSQIWLNPLVNESSPSWNPPPKSQI